MVTVVSLKMSEVMHIRIWHSTIYGRQESAGNYTKMYWETCSSSLWDNRLITQILYYTRHCDGKHLENLLLEVRRSQGVFKCFLIVVPKVRPPLITPICCHWVDSWGLPLSAGLSKDQLATTGTHLVNS